MQTGEGRRRVIIEGVRPLVDGGTSALKRTIGEKVAVEADIFADGHDILLCVLAYRKQGDLAATEVRMDFRHNDHWYAEFTVTSVGEYRYTLIAWVDHFHTWRRDLKKKADAGQDVTVEMMIGADLVEAAASRASVDARGSLLTAAASLRGEEPLADRVQWGLNEELLALMNRFPDRSLATTFEPELRVTVDRERARFSAWYEMFPRSCSPVEGRHGTLRDCAARLDYVAEMGFNVLYLPPIHPIGVAFRKGKNNAVSASPGDVGSPWAIGSAEGGHKAIHPELGTFDDFRFLVDEAQKRGIDVALDIAFQCSPDHPYVQAHPEWFKARPDGTIQYAENPPKKYQDIYPFDFETTDWQALWDELKSIFLFWIDLGVTVFRVDNPHTKAFPFWEWCIAEIKKDHPEVIFLAEAFTRPRIMYRLAKKGYTQSYTYFTWRNHKAEITEYLTELTQTEVRETFRPNFWPNTPDILPEHLHSGNPAAFRMRLFMAATLAANFGIYGPAFELCEHVPREPHSEEYLDSEKYQLRHWNLERPQTLRPFIARINRIRKQHRALQFDRGLRFHPIDSDQLLCYSKSTGDHSNVVLMVTNLDPINSHSGTMELPLGDWGIDGSHDYTVVDLLTDKTYSWNGNRIYVELNPDTVPGHIFALRSAT